MSDPKVEKRVIMRKRVARRWVSGFASPEYRMKVLYGAREIKNLPNLLRSFRDGKVAMEGIPSIPDLGIKETFDSVEVWSKNREALVKFKDWWIVYHPSSFATSRIHFIRGGIPLRFRNF